MSLVDEIKSRVKMLDVLEMYGFYPARGRNIYKCMYHNDNHPSAHIGGDGDYFYCFSCKVRKDVIDFVCDQEHCDRRSAMKILDSKFRLGLVKPLSDREQWLVDAQMKLRNNHKLMEKWLREDEIRILSQITDGIRQMECRLEKCHPTRRAYRTGEWELADDYFVALKEKERLEWLYDTICDFRKEECQYDHIYKPERKWLLNKIKKGKIKIQEANT